MPDELLALIEKVAPDEPGDGLVYVFDLDGTLCCTEHDGRRWRYEEAEPIEEYIEIVNALYDDGHTIIVDSARGSTSRKNWLAVTALQLRRWGVKHHQLRTGVKMAGDVFVDDRAVPPAWFFAQERARQAQADADALYAGIEQAGEG